MEIILIVIVVLFAIVILFLLYMVFKGQKNGKNSTNDGEIVKINTKLDEVITNNNALNHHILAQVAKIDTEITDIKKSNSTIPALTNSIASIDAIFKNSKARGNLGENALKGILQNIFGYDEKIITFQKPLGDGGIVDAYITIGDKHVAIDAKFPLDNFLKLHQPDADKKALLNSAKIDILNKIKEVQKYISFKNGIDNVIIFIPSEAIFTDITEN
jgi:DNA recombination protein RmuC